LFDSVYKLVDADEKMANNELQDSILSSCPISQKNNNIKSIEDTTILHHNQISKS